MTDQATKQDGKLLRVDNRREAYSSFFDPAWAQQMRELTNGTRICDAAFDLCADWKGTASTFGMPSLMMLTLDSFQMGFTQTHESFWQELTVAFQEYVLTRMGSSLSRGKRKKIVGVIDRISQDVQEKRKAVPSRISMDEIWKKCLKNLEFVFSLWSSQKLCYAAVYHAYENFLRRCVAIAKNISEYRAQGKPFQIALNECVGTPLGDRCLADEEIVIARNVRNSLAHNGGRATPEIRASNHKLTIENGTIHIMPDDIRRLFDLLRGRVDLLVERARHLPQFRM